MSSEKLDVNAALQRLTALMQQNFPDYGTAEAAADFRLVQEGKITEARLVEL